MLYSIKHAKGMLILLLAVVVALSSFAAAGMLSPAKVSACGEEGLTPGFWKNHIEDWPEHLDPTGLVGGSFPEAYLYGLGNVSLMECLGLPGGPDLEGAAQILLRAGVAALLNSQSPDDFVDYPAYWNDVETIVRDALASLDRDTMIDTAEFLDEEWNNLGVMDD